MQCLYTSQAQYLGHSTLHTLQSHFTLYTQYSILYIPDSALYTLHDFTRTLHTPHSPLKTLHFILYTPHCTVYTPLSTLYTLHFTLYTLRFTLHTLHFALHTLHLTLDTLHFPLHTLHFTLHTLHFTIHTLHFTLYTLHFPLVTLHSLHFTLSTPLYTLHSPLKTPLSSHCTLRGSTFHSLQCTGTVIGEKCTSLFKYLFDKVFYVTAFGFVGFKCTNDARKMDENGSFANATLPKVCMILAFARDTSETIPFFNASLVHVQSQRVRTSHNKSQHDNRIQQTTTLGRRMRCSTIRLNPHAVRLLPSRQGGKLSQPEEPS